MSDYLDNRVAIGKRRYVSAAAGGITAYSMPDIRPKDSYERDYVSDFSGLMGQPLTSDPLSDAMVSQLGGQFPGRFKKRRNQHYGSGPSVSSELRVNLNFPLSLEQWMPHHTPPELPLFHSASSGEENCNAQMFSLPYMNYLLSQKAFARAHGIYGYHRDEFDAYFRYLGVFSGMHHDMGQQAGRPTGVVGICVSGSARLKDFWSHRLRNVCINDCLYLMLVSIPYVDPVKEVLAPSTTFGSLMRQPVAAGARLETVIDVSAPETRLKHERLPHRQWALLPYLSVDGAPPPLELVTSRVAKPGGNGFMDIVGEYWLIGRVEHPMGVMTSDRYNPKLMQSALFPKSDDMAYVDVMQDGFPMLRATLC